MAKAEAKSDTGQKKPVAMNGEGLNQDILTGKLI
jgi:hypothetical protein